MIESKPQWPWRTMDSAPKNSRIIVYAPGEQYGLPDMVCYCEWHPDAGFCVDELRHPTMWMADPALTSPTAPAASEATCEAVVVALREDEMIRALIIRRVNSMEAWIRIQRLRGDDPDSDEILTRIQVLWPEMSAPHMAIILKHALIKAKSKGTQ